MQGVNLISITTIDWWPGHCNIRYRDPNKPSTISRNDKWTMAEVFAQPIHRRGQTLGLLLKSLSFSLSGSDATDIYIYIAEGSPEGLVDDCRTWNLKWYIIVLSLYAWSDSWCSYSLQKQIRAKTMEHIHIQSACAWLSCEQVVVCTASWMTTVYYLTLFVSHLPLIYWWVLGNSIGVRSKSWPPLWQSTDPKPGADVATFKHGTVMLKQPFCVACFSFGIFFQAQFQFLAYKF